MLRINYKGNRKFIVGILVGALLASGTAVGANLLNTPEGGYLLCVNKTTKVVTFPNAQKCANGFTKLILGAKGIPGEIGPQGLVGPEGPTGPTGAQGIPGSNGKDGLPGKDGAPGVPGGSGSSGPAGPAGVPGLFKVYDKNNELVGTLLGSSNTGTTFDVITPGGFAQSYDINGIINSSQLDVWFLDSACTGTPYAETRSLHRYLGDGVVDYNQKMYSDTKPVVMLKGSETYNPTNNFSTDRIFVPAAESRTATTIYTVTDYMSNSQTMGCYPYLTMSGAGRLGSETIFKVTELLPFTGTLRLRFAGSLSVR
jgi:hypothetical protein